MIDNTTINILYTNINYSLPKIQFEEYLNLFPEHLIEKTLRYKRQKGRLSHLYGKLLLIECLKKLNKNSNLIHEIKYDDYNRPYINSEIDFNISHSGKFAMCAITENAKIGIDIEKIRDVDLDNFNTIMSKKQWKEIRSSSIPTDTFFRYWSIKESVIKASGKVFTIPPDEILINNESAQYKEEFWNLTELKIDKEYYSFLSCNKISAMINVEEVCFL